MNNRSRSSCIGVCVLGVAAALGGCATGERKDSDGADFALVYLKSGPKSGQGTKEERGEIFKGHMANIHRLADEGKLVIAGPFDKPKDATWRGIFVMDVPDAASAQALAASDPGVIAGEFVADVREVRASASIRRSLAIERERTSAHERDTTAPPPNVRAYVMVTAENVARAERAVNSGVGHVVWCATFKGGDGGVIVIDSTDAAALRTSLEAAGPGPCVVDGWWSTTSLLELPPEARRLP